MRIEQLERVTTRERVITLNIASCDGYLPSGIFDGLINLQDLYISDDQLTEKHLRL